MPIEIKIPEGGFENSKLFVATPMYGGVCAGMYTRSMLDFGVACLRHGIEMKYYALFNESLITRARNYVADEFMRSDCDHLMFIDSDIGFNPMDVVALMALQMSDEKYDIIGGAYPKKSHPANSMVETEDGPKKIKWLVDNKYTGKVLTVNEKTGKFEWNRVVEHHVDPGHPSKKWVSIGRNGGRNKLVVTDDHELIVVDNPLKPVICRVEARNSIGKYILKSPVRNKSTQSSNPAYNDEQISILAGTLMGDGSITSKGYLKFGHSEKQKGYIKLKQELFGGKLRENVKIGSYYTKELIITEGNTQRVIPSEYREYYGTFLDCPRNSQILKLRELFYPNDKKSVTPEILDLLDEKSLAFWYMDDGSLTKDATSFTLCTDGFNADEQHMLVEWFKERWGIETKIHSSGKRLRVYFSVKSGNMFFELISKYVPIDMEYKIPEQFRGGEKHVFDTEPLDYGLELIDTIKEIDNYNPNSHFQPRKQYDIGVENNHNFVAHGYITSNCISWEKVKMAVDKGFGEEDPNQLDRYVGDFVFNPKQGIGSISLHEPAEVLEIGTGFMMIHRRVFESFNKHFPHMSYRPDHIRTEHFDGSREIMQYFQAEIDMPDSTAYMYRIKDAPPEEQEALINKYFDERSVKSKRYLSEDYWFTQRAQELGHKTWLCPWMKLAHVGTYVFAGSLPDLAELGASATADAGQLNAIKERKKSKK